MVSNKFLFSHLFGTGWKAHLTKIFQMGWNHQLDIVVTCAKMQSGKTIQSTEYQNDFMASERLRFVNLHLEARVCERQSLLTWSQSDYFALWKHVCCKVMYVKASMGNTLQITMHNIDSMQLGYFPQAYLNCSFPQVSVKNRVTDQSM